MSYTLQQTREAYKKLNPDVQIFIMDSETTDLISGYLSKLNITEDQRDLVDSEILYTMYNLQKNSEMMDNIIKITGKDPRDLAELRKNLDANIFGEIKKLNLTFGKSNILEILDEITKKYSLSEDKKNTLKSICKEIIDDIGVKDDALSNLDQKLNVSKLIAEQIAEELNKRAFDAGNDQKDFKPINPDTPRPIGKAPESTPVQNKTEIPSMVSVPKYASTPNMSQPSFVAKAPTPVFNQTPKVAPHPLNLPTDQPASQSPAPSFIPTSNFATDNDVVPPSRINFGKTTEPKVQVPDALPKSQVTNETVQRPVFVPTFTGTPLNDVLEEMKPKVQQKAPVVPNIIDTKLQGSTATTIQKPADSVPTKPTHSYTVDPYRESIQ